MAEIADVVPGEDTESTWGNAIRDRAVMRYVTEAARDASEPAPVAGRVCYITSDEEFQVFDGVAWGTVSGVGSHDDLTGVTDAQHHVKFTPAEAVAAARGSFYDKVTNGFRLIISAADPGAMVDGDIWFEI